MGERGRRYKGDFEQFCADDYARIVDAVALVLDDPNVAVDAVNEALSRAWLRVCKGHDIDSVAGWVRVVAINIGRDDYRRRSMQKKYVHQLAPVPAVTIGADQWGVSLDVRKALDGLPDRQREGGRALLYLRLAGRRDRDRAGYLRRHREVIAHSSSQRVLAVVLRDVSQEVAHSDAG